MSAEQIAKFKEYALDHWENFNCWPVEFECDGHLYVWDDFSEFIPFEFTQEL